MKIVPHLVHLHVMRASAFASPTILSVIPRLMTLNVRFRNTSPPITLITTRATVARMSDNSI